MKIISNINLNMQNNTYTYVEAVQNDSDTRVIRARLLDGKIPWKVPEGVAAAVAFCKPDRTKGFYNKLADGSPAVQVNGAIVTFVLTQQILAVPGNVQAVVVFNDENLNQLASFPFTIIVAPNPVVGAEPSEDYIRLQWLEDKLEEYLTAAKESGEFNGKDGESPTLLSDEVSYQAGDSGETIPTGHWSGTIPAVAKGSYLWTRRVKQWSDQKPIVDYSVAYQGLDGRGTVSAVAGVFPDSSGNVALTAKKIGALPAKKATPTNLLDNSDFRNPVNQRGNGEVHTNGSYPIDRWLFSQSNANCAAGYDPERKYFYLVNNNLDTDDLGMVYQNIPVERLSVGAFTLVLHEVIINPVCILIFADGEEKVPATLCVPDEHGTVSLTFTLSQSPTTAFAVYIYAGSGITVSFDWAALYKGEYTADTLPEYQPKGYGSELCECQRYLYKIGGNSLLGYTFIQQNGTAQTAVPLPSSMRIAYPSISLVGKVGYFDESTTAEGSLIDNSAVANVANVKFDCRFPTLSHGKGWLWLDNDSYLIISAEL